MHSAKTKDYLDQALFLYTTHRLSKRVLWVGDITRDMTKKLAEESVELTHHSQWQATEDEYDTIIWYDISLKQDEIAILDFIPQALAALAEGGNFLIRDKYLVGLGAWPAITETVATGEHLYLLANHMTPKNLASRIVYIQMTRELHSPEPMDMTGLRPLVQADTNRLADCLRLAYQNEQTLDEAIQYIRDALDSSEQPWLPEASWVFESEGHILGALITTRYEGIPLINQVFTRPECWGQGIARRLLQAAQESLRARGESRLRLYVQLDNPRAKQLYDSLGYQETGRGLA